MLFSEQLKYFSVVILPSEAGTTGLGYFAKCHKHWAKARKHSTTTLPSVAHDEAHTTFQLTVKPALPSAISRALGKVLPCARSHSAKKCKRDGRLGNVTGERDGTGLSYSKRDGRNWWERGPLPSTLRKALGKDSNFAEC